MSQESGHRNIQTELENKSQFRGTKCLRGKKIHSLVRIEPQTDKIHVFLY